MNFYLLTEGRTEELVYRYWLTYIFPELRQVRHFNQIKRNNFIVKSSSGYPFRNSVLYDAVATCNKYHNIDYLILIADSDDEDVETRKQFIHDQINREKIKMEYGTLKIFLQKRCFETWCLGSLLYNSTYSDRYDYQKFVSFYDVSKKDPEEMTKPHWFRKSNSIFHFYYFREMMKQKKQKYAKAHPGIVMSKSFFDDVVNRIDTSEHLDTFREFYKFLNGLNKLD